MLFHQDRNAKFEASPRSDQPVFNKLPPLAHGIVFSGKGNTAPPSSQPLPAAAPRRVITEQVGPDVLFSEWIGRVHQERI